MTPWRRFARFNAVGALGIVVQLSTIWALSAGARMPYLPATLVGVSAAILHNFLWHLRWTWGDRPRTAAGAFDAFVRFVAANGVVSIGGNAAIMVVLAGGAGWHPIPANVIAIAACGLLNFWLGDRLVFRDQTRTLRCAAHRTVKSSLRAAAALASSNDTLNR